MSLWLKIQVEDIDPDIIPHIGLLPIVEPEIPKKKKIKDTEEVEETEEDELIPEPEEELKEPSKPKGSIEDRIKVIQLFMGLLGEGATISDRINPILKPSNFKTTSVLTKGEVNMVVTFLTVARQAPLETEPFIDFCEDFCLTKLSEQGFAIEKAIEMGRALTETNTVRSSTPSPEKPTGDKK